MIFGFENGAKIQEKMLKMRCEKIMHFSIDFYWNFLRFGLRTWKENSLFFGSSSKKPILLKSLFFQWKIAIFLLWSFQNWSKFRCKFFFERYIGKNDSKIEFGHRFWPPKTSKIGPRSDVKRSLFRDAMQTARKSSKINGRRRW